MTVNDPEKEEDSIRDSLREMFEDKRTPEQKAHSKGFTEGYRTAEDRYQHRDEYLELLKVAEDPEFSEISGYDHIMTEDEAIRVWSEMHLMMEGHPEGRILIMLYDQLSKELAEGKRCGVCGRYSDPSCVREC